MYKIGDKVETEKGNGIIVAINGYEEQLYIVEITNIGNWGFNEHRLKPYRTAHEKLIDKGFTFLGKWTNGGEYDDYRYKLDDLWFLQIFHNINDLTYYTYDGRSDLELSRILTQYLEEMGEMK